jgi:hypothetical protein
MLRPGSRMRLVRLSARRLEQGANLETTLRAASRRTPGRSEEPHGLGPVRQSVAWIETMRPFQVRRTNSGLFLGSTNLTPWTLRQRSRAEGT